jgi:hypothetical protein
MNLQFAVDIKHELDAAEELARQGYSKECSQRLLEIAAKVEAESLKMFSDLSIDSSQLVKEINEMCDYIDQRAITIVSVLNQMKILTEFNSTVRH